VIQESPKDGRRIIGGNPKEVIDEVIYYSAVDHDHFAIWRSKK
jgi:hypothetical protein